MELNEGFLWSDKKTEGQAYIAQESVFFDFDIIQLTFNKDEVYTVIPVVSSPIDVVNDITPPVNIDDGMDWLKIILAVIMLILLIIILWPITPYVVKAIVWIITLPFKAISALIKAIKNRKGG